MNIIHLFWIIPLSGMVGFVTCAMLCANNESEER